MDDNIHNLRDALEWLYSSIRDEAELDGEMSNDHAIQLGFITNMLEKFPLRNCDVGTAEEQTERMWNEYCRKYECLVCEHGVERHCPLYHSGIDCRLTWAQMPYAVEEGGEGHGKA